MPIEKVVDLIKSLHLNSDNINTWRSGVERALKKYIPNGTKQKGASCKNCGANTVIYQEGCLIFVKIVVHQSVDRIRNQGEKPLFSKHLFCYF